MKKILSTAVFFVAVVHMPAHAISEKYRQQLENSGCTEVSESQGCDIHKSKTQNARAGFGTSAKPSKNAVISDSPYQGSWVAKNASGETISTIIIDSQDRVKIDGVNIKAKKSDGGLHFNKGHIRYTLQGDRRLIGEDTWQDTDAGTSGKILLK